MKHIITILIALLIGATCSAQNYKIEGKTITSVKTSEGSSSSYIPTDYTYQDSKGVSYTILLHKSTKGEHIGQYGAFIERTSAKTGNTYKAPCPNSKECYELGEKIAREMKLK